MYKTAVISIAYHTEQMLNSGRMDEQINGYKNKWIHEWMNVTLFLWNSTSNANGLLLVK